MRNRRYMDYEHTDRLGPLFVPITQTKCVIMQILRNWQ